MPEPDLSSAGGSAVTYLPAAPAAAPATSPTATAAGSGLAINNPLNLRPLPRGKWPGQIGVSASGFAIFDNISSGWAAADQNLQAKVRQHGLGTLSGIIGDPTNGWAPASDHNDPTSYAARVARERGVGPADDISQRLLADADFRHQVLSSMAGVETGEGVDYGSDEPHLLAAGIGAVPKATYDPSSPQTPPGPRPAPPPDPQAAAYGFLESSGFRDRKAPVGSSQNPAGQMPGKGIPSEQGSWYVTPDGKLLRTGDPTPDYLPIYQHLASERQSLQMQPDSNRMFDMPSEHGPAGGVTQGALFDVPGSINRLTGGYSDPESMFWTSAAGGPTPQEQAQKSLQGFQAERNQYDLLRHGDPVAATGRFFGQAVPITAATMGIGEGLSALGPAGEFMAGRAGGNLFMQGGSRLAGGAVQGGEAGALTSATNDRPVGQQIATGAGLGAAANVVEPFVATAANRMITGAPLAQSGVTDLAHAAMQRYGIPLRAGQVRAAAGDRAAATADSETLGSSPRFRANNDAQRDAWMRGVTSTYGDASGDVSPQSMQASRDRLGDVFDTVAAHTRITGTDALQTRLGEIVHDAQSVLPENEATPLLRQVENIGSTVENGQMSGESYQALTRKGAPLDRAMHSDNPNVAHYASQVREALDDALEASAAPGDLAALRQARFHYKNLMTVAKLAPKADVNGVISPTLLRGAVNTNFKNAAFQGAGDLGELARIGQTFMKEPPNSFTADRAAFRLGGADAAIGLLGETGGLMFNHPEAGALALGGVAARKAIQVARARLTEARLGPAAANRMLYPDVARLPAITPYVLPSAVIGGNRFLPAPADH